MITSDNFASVDTAITIPPIQIIGALSIMRSIILHTCCIWAISFVVLVIREAAPNLSNSCSEKPSALEKTSWRSIVPNPVAVLDDKKLPRTAQTVPATAMSSIRPPILKI